MISTSIQTMTFVLLMSTTLLAAAVDSKKADKEAADSKAIETLMKQLNVQSLASGDYSLDLPEEEDLCDLAYMTKLNEERVGLLEELAIVDEDLDMCQQYNLL